MESECAPGSRQHKLHQTIERVVTASDNALYHNYTLATLNLIRVSEPSAFE